MSTSQVQSQSQRQSQSSVNLYHYGTEVIVNLSPNTVVQVKINEAEFIVQFKNRNIPVNYILRRFANRK